MTTLHEPRLTDFSADGRATLERVAQRMGRSVRGPALSWYLGVQAYWPAWLEANFDQSLATCLGRGVLPALAIACSFVRQPHGRHDG